MGLMGVVILIFGSVLIGLALQRLGHARADYEWLIGTVGALYGGLVANAIVRPTPFVVDGLDIVPALIGCIVFSGLMLLGIRAFSAHSARSRQVLVTEPMTTMHLTLNYSPALLREAIISQMARQSGASISIGPVEVSGDRGWVELDLTGSQPALRAALAFARRSGVVAPAPALAEAA